MTDQQYAHVDRSNLARGPGFGSVTCGERKEIEPAFMIRLDQDEIGAWGILI